MDMELKAGTLTIKNVGKMDRVVMIYVPNKDTMTYTLKVGKTLTVTTQSAGETYTYMAQAGNDLEVTMASDTEEDAGDTGKGE